MKHLSIGIDTARYGHHASFLREDKQPACLPMSIMESRSGYDQLKKRLEQLHQRFPNAHLHETLSASFPELAILINDLGAGWVLQLLEKYPTSQRIAAARLSSLEKIPFIPEGMAEKLQNAAKTSVGTLDGDVAEELIDELVSELRHSLSEEKRWRDLLTKAFDGLPDGPHRGLLWQCAKCASAINGGNPAVRALYLRRLAKGNTPQIAWGYCMTKLLHQVFGIWTTGADFDPHYETQSSELTKQKTEASGPTDESEAPQEPKSKEVTAAPASLEPVTERVAQAKGTTINSVILPDQKQANRPAIDYAALREQVSLQQVT